MSYHHHHRTVGVKDKDHGGSYPTSLQEQGETAKRHKREGAAVMMTRLSRGSCS
jgi:hypothetical protein